MTQEEIIRMARECGDWNGQTAEFNDVGLERFATLVAEATKRKATIVCEEAFDAPEETMWNAAVEYVRKRLEKL